MYHLYKIITHIFGPVLLLLLLHRKNRGKETERSIREKRARSFTRKRTKQMETLLWIHAASVGESVSTLILIDTLIKSSPALHIMVTTGTLTSAALMEKRLPDRAFHHFCPLDHPTYIKKFLDHWKPDAAIWIESELWPNTLHALSQRNIPTALINARMSPKSFKTWNRIPSLAKHVITSFDKILCQTPQDKTMFEALGAQNCIITGNLKYSAAPLDHNAKDLKVLRNALDNRPIWLYASTHEGEEEIACRIHSRLKNHYPDLLTIIVPRHPERGDKIQSTCQSVSLNISRRQESKNLPGNDTDIYIADTLGELGLFYALCPIVCIGRTLSHDGGGGHNPIEAAQLGCAIIHGKNVQNLQDIFDQMHEEKACIKVQDEHELENTLMQLLSNGEKREEQQRNALLFAQEKADVITIVMRELKPVLGSVLINKLKNNDPSI